jgi:hypothetical protein
MNARCAACYSKMRLATSSMLRCAGARLQTLTAAQ